MDYRNLTKEEFDQIIIEYARCEAGFDIEPTIAFAKLADLPDGTLYAYAYHDTNITGQFYADTIIVKEGLELDFTHDAVYAYETQEEMLAMHEEVIKNLTK